MFKTSDDIKAIAAALAKAQAAFPDIPKDKEVKVKTKSGGEYSYWYAELSSIIKATRKPLTENELSFIQGVVENDKGMLCVTRLVHSSGQWYETQTPMILKETDMQGMAAALTFSSRYGLSKLIGVAAEDDTDGDGANRDPGGKGNNKSQGQKQQKPQDPPKEKVDWKPDPPRELEAMARVEVSKFVIPIGRKYKDKKLSDVPQGELINYRKWLIEQIQAAGRGPSKEEAETINNIAALYSELI